MTKSLKDARTSKLLRYADAIGGNALGNIYGAFVTTTQLKKGFCPILTSLIDI
jgi:hypothetical protein